MKNYLHKFILGCLLSASAVCAEAQNLHDFINPPADKCNHVILGWDGEINQQVIHKDLDEIQAKGFRNVIIEPGYHMGIEYLSKQWFANVKMMAEACKARNMKMWIIDEGKYPSGMAGGKFSKLRPDLCMQALVKDGDSVKAVRRSSNTRCVNNPTGGKDEKNSLCDYLDPKAVDQFIAWTHEEYKRTLGPLLGTTVLGFRGDEPAFQRVPWTTDIIDIFRAKKGYDPTPYLSYIIQNERQSIAFPYLRSNLKENRQLSENEIIKIKAAKADYWDVWSERFANNFFAKPAEWCKQHGVKSITHLDKDDDLPWCIKLSGEPFRLLNKVQIPGIDVIWTQIWPGNSDTEFPRLASSTAHLYNKERAFSESFAAWRAPLDTRTAKYVVDYQIARGINFFEFMFWMSKSGAHGYMAEPGMKALNDYVNRATYMMQLGKSNAQVALYVPIPTLWMGNNKAYDQMKAIGHLLTTHQYDFDFVTDDALDEAITPVNGKLINKSGQQYHTLIIPTADVITAKAWRQIKEFAARGGKVVYWGDIPTQMSTRNFQELTAIQPIQTALQLKDTVWTDQLRNYLPAAQLQIIGEANDSIVYTSRKVGKNHIFFVMNQRQKDENLMLELNCMGDVELWDAITGKTTALSATVVGNKMRINLPIEGWGSKIIVVKRRSQEYNLKKYATIQQAIDQAHTDGGGVVVVPKGKYQSGAIFLTRGVDLKLEKGAVLTSIVDTTLYPIIETRWEGRMKKARAAFINVDDNEDCRVYGPGLIDAQGLKWKKIGWSVYGRPKVICFNRCDGGELRDVAFRNQSFWCLHILYTHGFTVHGIRIDAEDYIPSSDGIDIDSSTGISITDSHIKAYDDCISIKSGKGVDGRRINQYAGQIKIENCHFDYGHGGVAIGSEVSGDIKDVLVANCDMKGENWNPIRFKSQPSRGGVIENITFDNIAIAKAQNMISVQMAWRMKGEDEPAYSPLTQLKNIVIRNITGTADNAGVIEGYPDAPIKRDAIRFENCLIKVKKPLMIKNADVDLSGFTCKLYKK